LISKIKLKIKRNKLLRLQQAIKKYVSHMQIAWYENYKKHDGKQKRKYSEEA